MYPLSLVTLTKTSQNDIPPFSQWYKLRVRTAFTLIELLIVIAIIAILAVVVVLVLNPAKLLKQSRAGVCACGHSHRNPGLRP